MAPSSKSASALRASTRPVSGFPARVAPRVYDDSGSTSPSWARRTEGVRIADEVSRRSGVLEGEQADELPGVGVVQVHAGRPDLREEGLGVTAEQVESAQDASPSVVSVASPSVPSESVPSEVGAVGVGGVAVGGVGRVAVGAVGVRAERVGAVRVTHRRSRAGAAGRHVVVAERLVGCRHAVLLGARGVLGSLLRPPPPGKAPAGHASGLPQDSTLVHPRRLRLEGPRSSAARGSPSAAARGRRTSCRRRRA